MGSDNPYSIDKLMPEEINIAYEELQRVFKEKYNKSKKGRRNLLNKMLRCNTIGLSLEPRIVISCINILHMFFKLNKERSNHYIKNRLREIKRLRRLFK